MLNLSVHTFYFENQVKAIVLRNFRMKEKVDFFGASHFDCIWMTAWKTEMVVDECCQRGADYESSRPTRKKE